MNKPNNTNPILIDENSSFKDAYEVLQRNANALEQSSELDIDNLITTVEESINAYKICQKRIHAVDLALKNAFDGEI
ncbi:exodeoxyribonuclease VII small subunit [Moraxella nasovis]|uniref:exodeoxyribonuclease VII small subunit n=1 Tax=Moraxella nasovis TaxID=2904121 RepID=UPI001F61CFB7|nr:exodeoxyribonuclease VII small subunit [Moraxella nasovis]UNU73265.1 exodeoxyribonuclease VII small subunit [Moraxella nasovis]